MPSLNESFTWITEILQDIARLKSGAFLENSSISNGRMRFIGGLLLIDSGGTLQVVGRFDGTGNFEWSGPWRFDSGDGEIAGNVKLTGDFDLTGQMDVTGGIEILGPGKIKVGSVIIENGKITAGTGAARVAIDGTTGKITAGDMTMDPTVSGGALTFANGAQVFTDAGTVQLYKGNSVVQVTDGYARLQNGGDVVEINANGIRMSPGALPAQTGTGLPTGVMMHGADGYVRKSDGS